MEDFNTTFDFIKNLETADDKEFTFDYRLTNEPILSDNYLELFFFGELTQGKELCLLP